MKRKRVILGILLGILAISLGYAYLTTPRLEKAPPKKTGQDKQLSDRKAPQVEEGGERQRIDFAYLELQPQEFSGAQRDIFQFGQRRIRQAAPRAPVVEKQVVQPVVLPEVVPVEVMQRSLSQFTFLGFLEKAGAKTVFLSSGGNLFLVKQGERFGAGREFLVEEIDDKLLKVRHAGRDGLIEVPLVEQQKLSAAVSAPVSVSRRGGPMSSPVNARVLRPQSRTARSLAGQNDQDFPGDMQPEEQVLQGDGNFWPEKQR